MIRFALVALTLLLSGCRNSIPDTQDQPPTVQEAVSTLRQHEQVIAKALRAKNPSAADEAMHDAMYLADKLNDFASESEIDPTILEEESSRLLKLLLKAHDGAHGGGEEAWQPDVLADDISACVTELETLLSN